MTFPGALAPRWPQAFSQSAAGLLPARRGSCKSLMGKDYRGPGQKFRARALVNRRLARISDTADFKGVGSHGQTE
jgi:hypothetical protein